MEYIEQNTNKPQDYGFPSAFTFWLMGFLYASIIALIFQKLLLPQLPALHAGNGLLHNDAVVFHELAQKAAEQISINGWSQWKLYPGAGGNVGLLSAVYALFGPEPAYFIPINAAAHSTGALCIYLAGQRLWNGRVGYVGGVVAGTLFLAFPSGLQWYGQNHKDAFAIAGILMMLYAWLTVFSDNSRLKIYQLIILMVGGAGLLAIVRPYYPVLALTAFGISWCFLAFITFVKTSLKQEKYSLLAAAGLLVVVLLISLLSVSSKENAAGAYSEVSLAQFSKELQEYQWKRSDIIPRRVDRVFERVSLIRAHFASFNQSIGATSAIDGDRTPDSATSMFAYLPRALIVGLFAPFPDTWSEKVSPVRLVGAVETLVWYVVSAGMIILFIKRPSRPLIAGLVFVFCLITILSYVHPNVGTLYRQRFGIWFFILLCGATGWAKLILNIIKSDSIQPIFLEDSVLTFRNTFQGRNAMERIATSGAVVLTITFCCYLGFMTRDLLLAKMNGMNATLDIFFTATMIPMVLVTFLVIPIPDAFTTPFIKVINSCKKEDLPQLQQGLLYAFLIILGVVTVLLIVAADNIIQLTLATGTKSSISEGKTLLRLFAPIVLLSAWTVIGNSILNSLNYSRQAALSQLIVPVLAITAILISPIEYSFYAAVIGMLSGTVINVLIVIWLTKRLGYSLWPRYVPMTSLQEVFIPYRWLALTALLTALVNPLNYYFASTLESGTVAVWALSSKMVLLFNGLAGVSITAVLLPHLARGAQQTNIVVNKPRNDIFFLLLAGTWISIGIAIVIFVFSEPAVYALLNGGNVSDMHISNLAEVLKIGGLQLPIVVSGMIVIKIVAVDGRTEKTLVASTIMLLINIIGNMILVPQIGVAGLALSSVIAAGLATAFLLVVERRKCRMRFYEISAVIVAWLVLYLISIAFHFKGLHIITTIAGGLTFLAFVHWYVWKIRIG